MGVYHAKSGFMQGSSGFFIVIKSGYSFSFRPNMVVPVITFPASLILRLTITAFNLFRFFYSEAAVKINKRRIYFLSLQIYHYTISRFANRFANGGNFTIFYHETSVFNNFLRTYVNFSIFKYGVVGLGIFYPIIFGEVFLRLTL